MRSMNRPRPVAEERPRLLVLSPLRIEARAVRSGGAGVQVVRVGMGPRHAANAAAGLASRPDGPVAVVGFGGALDPALRPGDLVVASEVRFPDGSAHALPSARILAGALQRAGLRAVAGPIACTDHAARGREREALRRTRAVAVDMESAWLTEAVNGRACAVLRAIVDTPSRELTRPLATATGALKAYRSISRAVPTLTRWAAATGPRRVLLAGPRSFCAGVERAIEIVERALDRFGAPVYVRKQIVHNVHVVRDLQRRGAVFVDQVEEVPDGSIVVFSAHGVSPQVRETAQARRLKVVDATCPLVTKVHTEARRFARSGHTIVLVGHEGHEEVEGTSGEAPGAIRLVEKAEDVAGLDLDGDHVAYLTQTTLAVDEVGEVIRELRARYPDLQGPGSDDICYATSNRQEAVKVLARESDLLLVIGSENSSNSKRLVEVAEREGCQARLIDDETEVDLEWLAGAETVGVTAGASAPEVLVDRMVEALRGLGPVEVTEREVIEESMQFTLPVELR
jgi:4-hydroxy-3-methylbut-2-en-1-yl diphosphate reductase